ncbi:HisA/HisF-related TIM barrel protein [Candidatus Vidania fulgoroideorum]
MVANRIIACLDIIGKKVCKGICFNNVKKLNNAYKLASRYYLQGADEIVILNIKKKKISSLLSLLKLISSKVFVPIIFGGNINSIRDAKQLFRSGTDKICFNSTLFRKPSLIKKLSNIYGKQSLLASIDVRFHNGNWYIYIDGGSKNTNVRLDNWILSGGTKYIGELIVTSIDRDGTQKGYDIDLIRHVSSISNINIIASGGAGSVEDIKALYNKTTVKSALIASFLHIRGISIKEIKTKLSYNFVFKENYHRKL